MQEDTSKLKVAYDKAISSLKKENTIGVQKEKILHRTLKYYLEEDDQFHEVKIVKDIKGILYADILKDNQIVEIQTRSFNLLRNKLEVFLKKYQVTVVFPIAYQKTIYKIDEKGIVSPPKKSPKKGSIFEVFKELYKIKPYLHFSNFSLKIILLDMDEYRNIVEKKHYRSSGYVKEVQIPTKIIKEIDLNKRLDYVKLLLDLNIKEPFTSNDVYKVFKVTKPKAITALNVLTDLKVVNRIQKRGNSYLYEINKNPIS